MSASPPIAVKHWHRSEAPLRSLHSSSNTLETHIYRLRQKFEKDAAAPAILVTEAGGYKLVP
jgi:DNA-binding response OmpR family regulator